MSILVCTPAYGGNVTAQHMKSCLELKQAFINGGMDHDWLLGWNESLIQRARNSMAARFMETGFKKLLFIDADIEFAPDDVAKLWNMNAGIACGLYPMKRLDCPLSAWVDGKLVDLGECPEEPFEVEFAGTGFMLIDREVFEAFRMAWPERTHEEGGVGSSFAWFDPRVSDGIYLSEDYAFVSDARSLGYTVMADPSIRLIHHGAFGYGAN